MPVSALWSLVICLAGLALGLAYKVAELTHRADRINKEAETLRSELDTLQKGKDKEISNIKELHQRESGELRKEIIKISHKDIPPEITKLIPSEQTKILELLFKQDNLSSEKVAEMLNIEIQAAEYHLEELQTLNMITKHTFRPEVVTPSFVREKHYRDYTLSVWKIEQLGRKYLMENVKV